MYFSAALLGNTVSYLWLNPTGAGNSMAVAGLLGILSTGILIAGRRYQVEVPRTVRLAAAALPILAVLDTALHDNHGLPLLLGMAMGLVLLTRRPAEQAGTSAPNRVAALR